MKKFTKYSEDKVDENKTFELYMELTQELFKELKDSITEKGYVLEEGDLNDYVFGKISEISRVLIDPTTLPDKPGEQTILDFNKK